MIPIASLVALQIPRPDPLPMAGPSWLFTAVLLLVFFLHILPMNLVLGGSLVTALARLKGKTSSKGNHHLHLSAALARMLPVATALAITFGVATLLFAQIIYGRLLYTSSILLGWYWFAVIPALILAYYGVYYAAFKEGQPARKGLAITWLSTLLFLLVAFIYSNNMSLMLRPQVFQSIYSQAAAGLRLNLDDTTLIPRYFHMILGSLAVTGLFTALLGLVRKRKEKAFAIWATRHGLLLFTGATALNLIIGTWFLLSFSREDLLGFMRTQPLGMTALALGIIFGLSTLGCGVLALHSERPLLLIKATVVTLVLTLLSMIVMRDQIRQAVLATDYIPASWVVPQWTLILLFFCLLVGAGLTIVWMLSALKPRH